MATTGNTSTPGLTLSLTIICRGFIFPALLPHRDKLILGLINPPVVVRVLWLFWVFNSPVTSWVWYGTCFVAPYYTSRATVVGGFNFFGVQLRYFPCVFKWRLIGPSLLSYPRLPRVREPMGTHGFGEALPQPELAWIPSTQSLHSTCLSEKGAGAGCLCGTFLGLRSILGTPPVLASHLVSASNAVLMLQNFLFIY